jgi:hypothetical protein
MTSPPTGGSPHASNGPNRLPGTGALFGRDPLQDCEGALGCVAYVTNGTIRDRGGSKQLAFNSMLRGRPERFTLARAYSRFQEPVEIGGIRIPLAICCTETARILARCSRIKRQTTASQVDALPGRREHLLCSPLFRGGGSESSGRLPRPGPNHSHESGGRRQIPL